MIQSYTKCSRGYLQEILQTTSLETLAYEVRNFFKLTYVKCEKIYLMLAAEHGYLGVYKLIAENFEDKNPKNLSRHSPLHEAALHGHLSICQFITKHTADKNPETVVGLTPFHYAAQNGHLEVYRFILEPLKVR